MDTLIRQITIIIICMSSMMSFAQFKVSGTIYSAETKLPIQDVQIYDTSSGLIAESNAEGYYAFTTDKTKITIAFFIYGHEVKEQVLNLDANLTLDVILELFSEELSAVEITAQRKRVFELRRLKDVEETAIYAGKKTEVVLVDQSMANLAANNARQLFSQVAGLNIFQNDDAGLQLNIGGRGLDPNRTSNFNTRQNGYDISADVLGYPESYYTPPSEALDEIQVIRGAASLQYGTQFGGLINFKFKEAESNKPIELITRNTLGSFGLYTNFTSLSGTANKLSYYAFFNYKKGDGFRPNSEFESKNAFAKIAYQISEKTSVSGELTYMRYLAQQAGGLNDEMFEEDPFQSNRTRNWFQVDWLLYNLKLSHQFSEKTNFTFSFFGLDASRKAIGFRGNYTLPEPSPVLDDDVFFDGEFQLFRDLQVGDYNNFGFESRLLSEYNLFNTKNTFLVGAKYYHANNKEQQGAGSKGIGPDFDFVETDDFINSNFTLPNRNFSLFGENIIRFSEKFTATPGFRLEYIKTSADGEYTTIVRDGAGNPQTSITNKDNRTNERSFVLLGLGLSYKPIPATEFYANVSQNYRSVTFSDIRIVNPSLLVDPDIDDESGQTIDLGVRGKIGNHISYDISGFGLFYNDRISIVLESEGPNKGDNVRINLGDAFILGFESLIDWNVLPAFNVYNSNYKLNVYNNLSLISSEYTNVLNRFNINVEGNEVEFVPNVNLKSGIRFGYKNLLGNIQFTYISDQFSDASNSSSTSSIDNPDGISGKIPAYSILDVSASYTYKNFKLETGINNLLDNYYFTRRALGYPGPGIIPSPPRNWYVTLEIRL